MKESGKNRSDTKTRYKQLFDELNEKRGCQQLKDETLDRTVWKTRYGRCYGHFVRETTEQTKL